MMKSTALIIAFAACVLLVVSAEDETCTCTNKNPCNCHSSRCGPRWCKELQAMKAKGIVEYTTTALLQETSEAQETEAHGTTKAQCLAYCIRTYRGKPKRSAACKNACKHSSYNADAMLQEASEAQETGHGTTKAQCLAYCIRTYRGKPKRSAACKNACKHSSYNADATVPETDFVEAKCGCGNKNPCSCRHGWQCGPHWCKELEAMKAKGIVEYTADYIDA